MLCCRCSEQAHQELSHGEAGQGGEQEEEEQGEAATESPRPSPDHPGESENSC